MSLGRWGQTTWTWALGGDDERGYRMTPKQVLAFVKTNGVVLKSGRGTAASPARASRLAEAVAGEPIRA